MAAVALGWQWRRQVRSGESKIGGGGGASDARNIGAADADAAGNSGIDLINSILKGAHSRAQPLLGCCTFEARVNSRRGGSEGGGGARSGGIVRHSTGAELCGRDITVRLNCEAIFLRSEACLNASTLQGVRAFRPATDPKMAPHRKRIVLPMWVFVVSCNSQ